MWNRIVALALLALQVVVRAVGALWRRRRGAAVFRENFEPEGLLAVTEAERALLPAAQGCTGCRACDLTCPFGVAPSRRVSADLRDLSALSALAEGRAAGGAGGVAAQCVACRACEPACPEGLPIPDLIALLEGYGERARAAQAVARPGSASKASAAAPVAPVASLILWALVVLCGPVIAGCADRAPSVDAPPAAADPLHALRAGAQSSEPLPEPLAAAESLQMPGNILTPDPTPWRHPAAVDGGTLRRGVEFLPYEYNWLTNNTTAVHQVNAYVIETVAIRHQQDPARWAPLLARSVTVSEDGTLYTIHLRRGVFWHPPAPQALEDNRRVSTGEDPVPLTARDFAFAFRMLKDLRVRRAAPARSWYTGCSRLEVIDDYTFTMRWDAPGLAARLGTLTFAPLPEHIYAFDSSGERYHNPAAMLDSHWYIWPIGTGPYLVEALNTASNAFLLLKRDPRYHGTKPAIETLSYERVDPDTVIDRFQQGLLDVVELSPGQYHALMLSAPLGNPFRTGELRTQTYSELGFSYIGWNMQAGPTADLRVRQALTLSLDRHRVARELAKGMATISSGPFPSLSPDADPDVTPLPFDLIAAAALLDEAGWRDLDGDGWRERVTPDGTEPLSVRVLFGSLEGDFWALLMEMYAHDLARVGVRLIPENLVYSDLNDEAMIQSGDFEGFVNGWGMDWENDLFQVWHSSQADIPEGSNRVGFVDDAADRLIESIRDEPDAARRLSLQHQLHRRIHDLQPYTFILEDEVILAFAPRIQGVRFQKLRPHDLSIPWWINER